jgi:outer membrane receptor protein involved in Fe transport
VGQYGDLDIILEVSATETEIVVRSDADIVEKEKTVQSSTIEETQIDNLPINGRNYLDFTLLTPGSSGKNSLVSFSAPQAPDSGLSFAGQDQRSNYVTIDGADNIDIVSSGVRSTLSQEAIQEFQISRNTFSAEFGRARAGLINIVSKSGTNAYHGNAFFFFRNNRLDARNSFSELDDPPFSRYEYGGTMGGPIVRDKTFFFTSYEHLDREESNFVSFLDDPSIFEPTESQNQLFGFLASTGILPLQVMSAAFVHPQFGVLRTLETNFPDTLRLFERESGIFPFQADQDVFSLKLDHQLSGNNSFYARVNYGDSFDPGVDFGALQGVSNGISYDKRDFALVLSDSHIFSPTTLNEARFQFARRDFTVQTNDPTGPEIILSGVAQFGQEFFNPTAYDEDIFQFADNVTFIRGNHTLKFGADASLIDINGFAEVFLGGQFTFGEAIPLKSIMDRLLGAGVGDGLQNQLTTPLEQGGLGRPDLVPLVETPISSVQSYNFGLPITYFQGFGDPNTAINYYQFALFFQDGWRLRDNFTLNLGLRYDTDWRPETVNVESDQPPFQFDFKPVNDRDNFSPRVGFAWDPYNNGSMVVRGGYGIYYQNFFQAIAFVSQVLSGPVPGSAQTRGISQVFLPLTGLPGIEATSADVWGAFQETGKVDEQTLEQLGVSPGSTPSVILPGAGNVKNPYSQHASLGTEWRVARDWALALDYILNKGTSLIRSRDINVREVGFNRFALPGLNPNFVQVNMIETSGSSIYHGFTTSLRKRFSGNHAVQVSYTVGKAIDDTTDFITQLQANNQKDLASERALSSFDQRQRLVVSGVWQSPVQFSGESVRRILAADWTVSPIVTVASGRPFNLLLGFDLNGDTHEETDRPVLSDGAIAGRNTGIGPDFYAVDFRVARRFVLSPEDMYLEFIFDAFNLANNVNYSGVNNVVGRTSLSGAHVKGSKDTPANQPLGFTSAFDPRQIQFGFRFNF